MRLKYWIFAVFGVLLLLNSVVCGVDTRGIDAVRNKGVLDSKDLKVIEDFISESIDELVMTDDFATIADIRALILSKKGEQSQYAEQFSESCYKYLYASLKSFSSQPKEEYRYETVVNLLMLLDGLEDVRLMDLAIDMLKDENGVVRYWAVHSITNPGVVEQLVSATSGDMKLLRRISGELKDVVDSGDIEMLSLVIDFCSSAGSVEGDELGLYIADKRIKAYAGWTIEYELLDGKLLKFLSSKISSDDKVNIVAARRFCQLYSYVLQRYVKGREFLSDEQKQQLASVLVEVEKYCISELLGMPQSVIKKAIEGGSYMGLLYEHSRLLGDETRQGELGMKFNFDYGTKPGGGKLIEPTALPEPPVD